MSTLTQVLQVERFGAFFMDNLARDMLIGGTKAAMKAASQFPSSLDVSNDKLESSIEANTAEQIVLLLEECETETPKFLNGVLVDRRSLRCICELLSQVNYDLNRARRYEHEFWRSAKIAQAQIAGLVSGALEVVLK